MDNKVWTSSRKPEIRQKPENFYPCIIIWWHIENISKFTMPTPQLFVMWHRLVDRHRFSLRTYFFVLQLSKQRNPSPMHSLSTNQCMPPHPFSTLWILMNSAKAKLITYRSIWLCSPQNSETNLCHYKQWISLSGGQQSHAYPNV